MPRSPSSPPSIVTVGRRIWGGRAPVRATLYMTTVAATRHNPVLATFYRRLRGAGKAAKVALVATMRKLLTIVNGMMKQQSRWNSDRLIKTVAVQST